jgi:hypothetical protein
MSKEEELSINNTLSKEESSINSTTRHPSNNIDHDSLRSTQGCTNTATLPQAEPNHDCLTMIV